ncbi:MAG TPA: YncE family protein, partial [Gemmatimonadaceae bacterium]|nr:YncE family protein [Gemmatimonadaceae bacterium]
MTRLLTTTLAWCGATLLAAGAVAGCRGATPDGRAPAPGSAAATRLPTGTSLDPAGPSLPLGSMPLAIAVAPGGGGGGGDRMAAVLLGGWREQGLQVVDRASGRVVHTLPQASAFFGLAFSPDGRTLYTSGGNQDVVYRYAWNGGDPALRDSIVLARKAPTSAGTRYPAGLALSPDGRTLYVAENLADSLAVVDVATKRVIARYATERYPLAVVVAANGTVYVSAWGGSTVSVFTPASHAPGGAPLVADGRIAAGRHPSALLLDAGGTRLYVASGSTDRVTVVDTRTRRVVATLRDDPPGAPGRGPAPGEGSTPDALALSADGTRLFVAEADNNAVAVFDLSAATSGRAAARGADTLGGRIPVEWYPTALATVGGADTLLVVSGKGRGTGPNPDGPTPYHGEQAGSRSYTLGQTTGSLMTVGVPPSGSDALTAASARVARANRWGEPRDSVAPYPPIAHVLYVIKENRTYDEVLGDLPAGDGDS